ncbi:hypothetical protein IQ06DRAFT_144747 [Phaeosphaeriaceae sp. SRC1lsM3a]|nr:hypothetical protein IQ06DRAFT_144747 [Stagonospora sp. SRC1lsM3a]
MSVFSLFLSFFLGRIEISRMIPCISAARFDGFHYLRCSIYGHRSRMALRLWDLLVLCCVFLSFVQDGFFKFWEGICRNTSDDSVFNQ